MLTKLDLMDEGTDVYDVLTVCTSCPCASGTSALYASGQKVFNVAINRCLTPWLPKTRSSGGTTRYHSVADRCGTQYLSRKLNGVLVTHNKIIMLFI